jgi:hypothetical protein
MLCARPADATRRARAVWSNFEIADLDFWRGPAYSAYFDFLDAKGGFYYEVLLPFLFSRPGR